MKTGLLLFCYLLFVSAKSISLKVCHSLTVDNMPLTDLKRIKHSVNELRYLGETNVESATFVVYALRHSKERILDPFLYVQCLCCKYYEQEIGKPSCYVEIWWKRT